MKILITGGTGLIGKRLRSKLLRSGHELVLLSRTPEKARRDIDLPVDLKAWDPEKGTIDTSALTGVEAVIHLAGEGIADKRWTETQKAKILKSRVESGKLLASALAKSAIRLKTFISASAIGYYGTDRGDEILTENSSAGTGFLADVCTAWEKVLDEVPAERKIAVRIGIVLANEGGALAKMLPIFQTGMAGPLGNGKQWMSWIHIDDLIHLFVHLLEKPAASGAYNGTAPVPVSNRQFTRALSRALAKPAFLPAPKAGLKVALGEMSDLLLGSTRVLPERTLSSDFAFQFTDVGKALEDLLVYDSKRPYSLLVEEQWLPIPLDRTFPFFSDPKNLEAITPPWLNFQIVSQTTATLQKDTRLRYRLKIRGIPVTWESNITVWDPPSRFVDRQTEGPYRLWNHTHTFETLGSGVLMTDKVRYLVPGGILGRTMMGKRVKKDLQAIFSYRQKKIRELLVKGA
jgi:uncharacterized protein